MIEPVVQSPKKKRVRRREKRPAQVSVVQEKEAAGESKLEEARVLLQILFLQSPCQVSRYPRTTLRVRRPRRLHQLHLSGPLRRE